MDFGAVSCSEGRRTAAVVRMAVGGGHDLHLAAHARQERFDVVGDVGHSGVDNYEAIIAIDEIAVEAPPRDPGDLRQLGKVLNDRTHSGPSVAYEANVCDFSERPVTSP